MGEEYKYKLVVIGGGGVGKSAITVRFIQGNFVGSEYCPTIEDSYRKQVEIDEVACLLEIMDTAGQEEYSSLRDTYMKGGEGFLLVFAVTSTSSFDQAQKLSKELLMIKEDTPDIPVVLVGNKIDLEDEREVSKEDAEEFARQKGMPYIETSAKQNINVHEVFRTVVLKINEWRAKHRPQKEQEKKKTRHSKCNIL